MSNVRWGLLSTANINRRSDPGHTRFGTRGAGRRSQSRPNEGCSIRQELGDPPSFWQL